ncbi:MAG: hypothetical protein JHD03_06925 [Solirubrobacteraceae bacterium]|nr:hypothetical protein [Solirubrobacteraceae bacterium]
MCFIFTEPGTFKASAPATLTAFPETQGVAGFFSVIGNEIPMIVRGQKYVVFFAGAPMLVPVSGVVMVVGTKCAPADGRTASPATAATAAAIPKLFKFILKTSVSVLSNECRVSAPDQQINKQL